MTIYIEPHWTEHEQKLLKYFKDYYQTSAPGEPFSCNWQAVAKKVGHTPGECLRQHCSFTVVMKHLHLETNYNEH
ncbi:hypothetical protein BC941DRAFT_472706 [Chlamydoabsidia padenii]|nr:hypothetical protein BC941DRAFT_472706 [Chlamydoabsidia padenii]